MKSYIFKINLKSITTVGTCWVQQQIIRGTDMKKLCCKLNANETKPHQLT